jgi:hypothetical protein
MSKTHYAPLWALLGLLTVGAKPEDVTLVQIASVPSLKPLHIVKKERGALPVSVQKQFKFYEVNLGYGVGNGDQDPNELYRKARPLPEMAILLTKPFSGLEPRTLGVEAIEGFRLQWQPPATEAIRRDRSLGISRWKEERKVMWRWDVPVSLKRCWESWTCPSGDRYAALVLAPPKGENRNPQLCYFDAPSGFQWKQEIPLNETLLQMQSLVPAPADRNEDTMDYQSIQAGITEDGSRILVIVPRSKLDLSVLFVYSDVGILLHTFVFPGHKVTDIFRTPQGQRFLLRSSRTVTDETRSGKATWRHESVSYLIDAEGQVKCRFEDEEGRGFVALRVSADEAFIFGLKGTSGPALIYALPGSRTDTRATDLPLPSGKP